MNNKVWDYRVVRRESEDGSDELLSVQEVYYDDDETPMAHTTDLEITGDNIADLRKTLQSMLWCLDKDIVPEIESEVAEQSMEDRVLSLELENAEMRDRLVELGDTMTKLGVDGHGNEIHEAPDGDGVVVKEGL